MNYRNTRCYLNCEKRVFVGVGQYQFPEIKPIQMDVEGVPLLGFNYAKTEKEPENKIAHFFLDDYQFERVWNNPDMYLNMLGRFKAVISPDFSLYVDFPKAIQMFNHYRRQWCGAYWQEFGINVIPTVRWSDESSYEWCFDGIPRHSLVCISTFGGFKEKEVREKWLKGYHKALEVLEPSHILFFGKVFKEIDVPVPYTHAVNQNTLNRELARKKLNEEKASLLGIEEQNEEKIPIVV